MRSTVAKREALRERVKNLIPQMNKSEIVHHFVKEGIARSTVYDAINRMENDQPIKDNKRTGRPTSWTTQKKNRLKRLVNNRTGVSQRRLGKKFGLHQTTIGRQLAKMRIQYRKREKTPKYDHNQLQKAEELSGKLANLFYRSSCSIIIYDEKYFTFKGENMPGNAGYYSNDKSTCPDNVRFAGKEKFPQKVMVWIAISDRGISEPLIRPSKSEAINSDIYIEECLKKKLLPFIHEFHQDLNYIFWPDLASAHYSKATVDWMEKNINYVAKKINPPNVPQARPIENFWSDLCQKVYEDNWAAKTEKQLIRRISNKLKDFDLKSVETHMSGVKAKVKSIGDTGVFSYLKK